MQRPLSEPSLSTVPEPMRSALEARKPIHIYRILGNAPQLVFPWLDMVDAVYEGTLSNRLREICILRTAAKFKSEYVYKLHSEIAKGKGLGEDEIAQLRSRRKGMTMLPENERVVCDFIDNMAKSGGNDLDRLAVFYSEENITEILVLVSFYTAVAHLAHMANLRVEEGKVFEEGENP